MHDIQKELQFYAETIKNNIGLYKSFWTKKMPIAFHSPPSEYTLDEYKFRKYNIPSSENPKYIFCFGCEITFGNGLKDEETWPYILSKKLSGNFVPLNYGTIGASLEYNAMCFYQLIKTIPKEKYPAAAFFHLSNPYRAFYIGNNKDLSPIVTHINIDVDEKNTIEKIIEEKGNTSQKIANYYSYTSSVHTFFRMVRYFKLIDQISINSNVPWFSYSTNPFFNNLKKTTLNYYFPSNFSSDFIENDNSETNEKTAAAFELMYEKYTSGSI